jgi:orotidine-5'-phosphate decarboxylase
MSEYMKPFQRRLASFQKARQSLLCVGLDPDIERIPSFLLARYEPAEAISVFCREIIEATAPFASAYKPNLAFFEMFGPPGLEALADVIRSVGGRAIVVADAKRGDIGNTSRFYAHAVFDDLKADSITVSPYMGHDSVTPFLEFADRGVFVLARTSNTGAADFQERIIDGEPLYLHVVREVVRWDASHPGAAGLVAGATSPEALARIRRNAASMPILIPGVGAQGGDIDEVMAAADARPGLVLINSSRQILYASQDEDYARRAADVAASLAESMKPIEAG